MFERFERIEQRLNIHEENFNKLENKTLNPKRGILYNGQIFDACVFVNDLLKLSVNEIILIDNYIDKKELYHHWQLTLFLVNRVSVK
jgi:hypothetical protein